MGVNSLPKTVTRQRHGCDLNPGPSAPESSTLTTRLPSHPSSSISSSKPVSHEFSIYGDDYIPLTFFQTYVELFFLRQISAVVVERRYAVCSTQAVNLRVTQWHT